MRVPPVLWLVMFLAACGSPTAPGPGAFTYDFSSGAEGWVAGSSDYSVAVEPGIELLPDWRPLPAPLDQTRRALYLAGNNYSEDLFMFYKKQVTGLPPGRTYTASFTAEIATDVPHGCVGIGGLPGEHAYVKAGVSAREPTRVLEGTDYVMNISKGNHSRSGSEAVAIGNMANSLPCDPAPGGGITTRWEVKSLASVSSAITLEVPADGTAWLIIGVDLAPWGRYELYITKFSATLERVN